MNIKELRDFAKGVGVGAAGLMIALGAVSLFLRPGAADPGQHPSPLPTTRKVLERPELPPADYLDLCRAAGL